MLQKLVPAMTATLCFAALTCADQTPPKLATGLPAGPYAVGFRRQWCIDHSRMWELNPGRDNRQWRAGRPLRIDVWYPAAESRDAKPLTLRDYLHAQGPDAYFDSANKLLQQWAEDSYQRYARTTHHPFETMMSLPTTAHLHAVVRSGQYPLVIYSGGWYNRSPDNIALAEYLASHGYVVAAVPHLGVGLWNGDVRSTPLAIETQIRDVETALGTMIEQPWVDRARLASMGYSTGGTVALLLQGRNPLIKAVVGLDPSYCHDSQQVVASPFFSSSAHRCPILTLRSGHKSQAARDPSILMEAMPFANRYTAAVVGGTHGDFGDDVVIETALSLVRPGEPRSTAEGIAAYRASVQAVKQFLDGVLLGHRKALEAMAAGTDVLRIAKKPAAPIPTSDEWVTLLYRDMPSDLAKRAEELTAKYPNLPAVIERELNGAGYRLLREGNTSAAVRVMRFNMLTHPNSANAHDSLADACNAAGDHDGVIEAYRGLLQALPKDSSLPSEVKERLGANAEAELKRLRGKQD